MTRKATRTSGRRADSLEPPVRWRSGAASVTRSRTFSWRKAPAGSAGLAWRRASCVVFVAVVASTSELDVLFGGGTWQSLVLAVLGGTIVVTVSLWLVDVFQRRVDHQGRIAATMSRAAFAAFLVHQGVLVALVLGSRQAEWPPEVKYLAVASLGVALSFAAGSVLVRVPGLSRLV